MNQFYRLVFATIIACTLHLTATSQSLSINTDGSTADGGNGETPALAGPAVDPLQKRIDEAKRLAKENPAAVANIVRGWVNREAA